MGKETGYLFHIGKVLQGVFTGASWLWCWELGLQRHSPRAYVCNVQALGEGKDLWFEAACGRSGRGNDSRTCSYVETIA